MTITTKKVILIVVALQIVIIAGLLALPAAVQAIPGRYRVALSERNPLLGELAEDMIDRVAPVATALPAANVDDSATQVDISSLLAQPTATAAAPTPTEQAEAAIEAEDDVEAAEQEPELAKATPTPTAQPTATPTPEPTSTPEPLPESLVLEGVSAVKQSFNNCGPANLTQVLNFHDYDITQAQVADYLKPNAEDRNVSPWQIADYVNEQSPFMASAHSGGTQEMLKRFIAAGLPVVVEKGYELPQSGWWGHYLTLYGYDNSEQEFYGQDSYLGPFDGSGSSISYEALQVGWQQFNYTFYIVYGPEDEATVQAILGASLLDEFAMWNNAASLADKERQADPENVFAWFNLGTSLTRMGQLTGSAEYYQGGAQAFDKARELGLPPRMLWYQFRPYMAYWKVERHDDVIALADATLETQGGRNVEETYWYKGHALLSQGNVAAAREAYQAALAVNENFYPAQISLDSLN